jgi:hypothetical protein
MSDYLHKSKNPNFLEFRFEVKVKKTLVSMATNPIICFTVITSFRISQYRRTTRIVSLKEIAVIIVVAALLVVCISSRSIIKKTNNILLINAKITPTIK